MSQNSNIEKNQRQIYVECLEKQMEEIQLLSSIYCGTGELEILDPLYVCEFEKFLKDENALPANILQTPLEFIIKIEIQLKNKSNKEFLDVRIQLPHLYPNLEYPIITMQSNLLNKIQTQNIKTELNNYMEMELEKQTPYIYQILLWIQENVENLLKTDDDDPDDDNAMKSKIQQSKTEVLINFERLWIYSHHIKSKTKRQEIIKQSRDLDLSGFSRPGKPGIICVEGLQTNTQEFWRIIKSLHWQKITINKSEIKHTTIDELNKLRRFQGFKEQLFYDDDERGDDVVMDMSAFVKFLEAHNSSYMKKELFGFE